MALSPPRPIAAGRWARFAPGSNDAFSGMRTPEDDAQARQLQEEMGLGKNFLMIRDTEQECPMERLLPQRKNDRT